MPSSDVIAATRLAKASWRRDKKKQYLMGELWIGVKESPAGHLTHL